MPFLRSISMLLPGGRQERYCSGDDHTVKDRVLLTNPVS
jgi:hypothetical protein